MTTILARRRFLQGSLAVAVVGWNPGARSWASGHPGPGNIQIPSLDGELLTDAATLGEAADDFGHIVHHAPLAVLVPGSIDDIVKMVKFARRHGLKVAGARGIGESHSTDGQSQAPGGVVIDMRALATIHEINAGDALVDAGVRWIELIEQTAPLGKSPPTLTDYIDLSVGGTLSVGGIGGQAFRAGFQVDNVIELEVVTGEGKRVTCSATHEPLLFAAVRAGLGQFAIIVRARVRLEAVLPMVRTYHANYSDLAAFTADQVTLTHAHRFDYIEGQVVAAPGGGWQFLLEVARYFDPAAPPDDAALLAGLSFDAGTESASDSTFFDFANRLAPTVAFLQSIGVWSLPHPWFDLFVPGSAVVPLVQSLLDQTTVADTGQGPLLLYPFKRAQLTAPFLTVPHEPVSFLFDILRTAVPPTPEVVSALIARNRAFYDEAVTHGAKRYPISTIPFTPDDWKHHFGLLWGPFEIAKAIFDPDNVLTPGQGIFLD
jgi:cytokinin dehydrogenase